jgi:hypothetical protein
VTSRLVIASFAGNPGEQEWLGVHEVWGRPLSWMASFLDRIL